MRAKVSRRALRRPADSKLTRPAPEEEPTGVYSTQLGFWFQCGADLFSKVPLTYGEKRPSRHSTGAVAGPSPRTLASPACGGRPSHRVAGRPRCWFPSPSLTPILRLSHSVGVRRLRIVSETILYRNPHPGHQTVCAYLPNVVPLSERELLCFYRLGQAFYSLDGRLAVLRSTDGGENWIEEGDLWDPQQENTPHSYSAPHGTLLRDGTLLLVAHRFRATQDQMFRFNPETGGLKPFELVLFRSADRGRTWSPPQVIEVGGRGVADAPSNVIELNDGSLFLALERWKSWDDTSPLQIRGSALFSRDGGAAWGKRSIFPVPPTRPGCTLTAATAGCWTVASAPFNGPRASVDKRIFPSILSAPTPREPIGRNPCPPPFQPRPVGLRIWETGSLRPPTRFGRG